MNGFLKNKGIWDYISLASILPAIAMLIYYCMQSTADGCFEVSIVLLLAAGIVLELVYFFIKFDVLPMAASVAFGVALGLMLYYAPAHLLGYLEQCQLHRRQCRGVLYLPRHPRRHLYRRRRSLLFDREGKGAEDRRRVNGGKLNLADRHLQFASTADSLLPFVIRGARPLCGRAFLGCRVK